MNRRELLARSGPGLAGVMVSMGKGSAQTGKSLVERLGHPKNARLLVIHADDIGMCHSVNEASTRALTQGVASAGSVMAPCPWFPEIAAWSREHPEADLGLHLTLTSEWRYYRWRPVSPAAEVKGLVDPEGFLWRSVEEVVAHAKAEEVEREIRAQIIQARRFGMKPTHVDSHMGTLFSRPGYFDAYVRVAREEKILPMLMEPTPAVLAQARAVGVDYAPLARRLTGSGFVLLDLLNTGLKGDTLEARRSAFQQVVRDLKPGVTELIVHLAGDDEEIRHVTGNWAARYHDFQLVTDPATRAFLKQEGVQLVGYRQLAALWGK